MRIDSEGYEWHQCKGECKAWKEAFLFMPREIETGSLRCRVCIGEVNKGRYIRPTFEQLPKMAGNL